MTSSSLGTFQGSDRSPHCYEACPYGFVSSGHSVTVGACLEIDYGHSHVHFKLCHDHDGSPTLSKSSSELCSSFPRSICRIYICT